jgi:hypothetical protein
MLKLSYICIYFGTFAAYSNLEICIGSMSKPEKCFIALEGSAWHNWGLTYIERAARYMKYSLYGIQPKRTLKLKRDYSTFLQVTNKGR